MEITTEMIKELRACHQRGDFGLPQGAYRSGWRLSKGCGLAARKRHGNRRQAR